jgi:hypothetical protein
MYLECKAGGLTGAARIGRVTFSQTGRTLYYRGQKFQSLKGAGFKSNYYDVDTADDYWISGPKRDGGDALYGGGTPIEIDDDVARSTGETSGDSQGESMNAWPKNNVERTGASRFTQLQFTHHHLCQRLSLTACV